MRADPRRKPGARPEDRRVDGEPARAVAVPATDAAGPRSRGGAQGGELDRDSVMRLQQSLGNQGVADLLGKDAAAGSDRVGAGEQLDEGLRADMEARFGRDLSDVQVHTGSEAGEQARKRNAAAYSDGDRIVFDQGRYDPSSEQGRELVAHELAHVVQQREGGGAQADAKGMPATDPTAEQEAGEAGRKAARGERVELRQPAAAGATHHAENASPLEGAELSGEQAETVAKVKEAAKNETWSEFEEWWREQQETGPAKAEAAEESEQSVRLTEALERELQDVFGETADALRDIGGALRESNPGGAGLLSDVAADLAGSATLNRDDDIPYGLGKVLETMRLYFIVEQIRKQTEELRNLNVQEGGPQVAGALEQTLALLEPMRYRIPDAAIQAAGRALDEVRRGGLFPETGPAAAPPDQDFEQLLEAFDEAAR